VIVKRKEGKHDHNIIVIAIKLMVEVRLENNDLSSSYYMVKYCYENPISNHHSTFTYIYTDVWLLISRIFTSGTETSG
jgi:hypothetical protein